MVCELFVFCQVHSSLNSSSHLAIKLPVSNCDVISWFPYQPYVQDKPYTQSMVLVKMIHVTRTSCRPTSLPGATPWGRSTVEKSHGHEIMVVSLLRGNRLKPVTIGGTFGRKHTGTTTGNCEQLRISFMSIDNFAEWTTLSCEKQQRKAYGYRRERRPIAPSSLAPRTMP